MCDSSTTERKHTFRLACSMDSGVAGVVVGFSLLKWDFLWPSKLVFSIIRVSRWAAAFRELRLWCFGKGSRQCASGGGLHGDTGTSCMRVWIRWVGGRQGVLIGAISARGDNLFNCDLWDLCDSALTLFQALFVIFGFAWAPVLVVWVTWGSVYHGCCLN